MIASKSTAAPPQIIAGRYRIEAQLGQGGMGSVWRAQHLTLRSPVAIKLIDPALAKSEDAMARFLREAQAAASLRSPHVVQILDHGIDEGLPYIAMELLEGESLAARLLRTARLSPAETARVMTHVARAMARAHEAGIVHRDLKPDNVFLVRNDDEEIAKVLDFGIAKATNNAFEVTTGTRTGAMLGTPYYMSPEQVEGSKSIDHRSDLWAMAVIAFECLTGLRPFQSDTLGALLLQICSKPVPVPSQYGKVPPGFDEWFARATRRAPDERFQSAREMVDALRVVLTPGAQAAAVTPRRGTSGSGEANEAAASEAVPVSVVRDKGRGARVLPLGIAIACVLLLAAAALLLNRSRPGAGQAAVEGPQHIPSAKPAPAPSPVEAPAAAATPTHAPAAAPAPPATPARAATAPAPVAARPEAAAPAAAAKSPAAPRARPERARPPARSRQRAAAPLTTKAAPTVAPKPTAANAAPKPVPTHKPTDLGF